MILLGGFGGGFAAVKWAKPPPIPPQGGFILQGYKWPNLNTIGC